MRPATTSPPSLPESRRRLALLGGPALIWMLHFLLSYTTAAVWCARASMRDDGLGAVRMAIAGYTAVAIAALLLIAVSAWRRHRHDQSQAPHDADTAEDRHQFLGLATLLIAGLGIIATIYVALSVVFISTCR